MTETVPPPRRRLPPEHVPWYLVGGVTMVLLALVVASAGVYTSVTQAHANSYFIPTSTFRFQGTDARAVLEANGSIRFGLTLNVTNPSPRTLDFQSIIAKAWIANASTPTGFFLAFLPSFDVNTLPVPPPPIPPSGTGSLRLNFTLSRAIDAMRFDTVQRIQNAVANATGTAAGIKWNVFVLITLAVEGIPDPSATAGTYQLNLNRVILQEGVDLGA